MLVVSHWLYSQIGILPNRNIRHFCLTPRPFEFVFSSRDRSGLVTAHGRDLPECVVFRDEHIPEVGPRAPSSQFRARTPRRDASYRNDAIHVPHNCPCGGDRRALRPHHRHGVRPRGQVRAEAPFGSNAPRDDPFLPFAPPTRARLTTSSPRPPLAGATARVSLRIT